MQVQPIQNQQNFNGKVCNMIPPNNKPLKKIIDKITPELNEILKPKDYNLGFFEHHNSSNILEVAVADATLSGIKPVSEKLFKKENFEFSSDSIFENAKRLMREYEKQNQYNSFKNRIKRYLNKLFNKV